MWCVCSCGMRVFMYGVFMYGVCVYVVSGHWLLSVSEVRVLNVLPEI